MSSSPFSEWEHVQSPSPDRYLRHLEERNKTVGAFLDLDPTRRADEAGNGIPIGVKDNIAVRDFQLSCGSRIMGDHVSPYDATIVERLISAGYVPIGKTNLDEFGMGSSTETSALGETHNPWDVSRVAGGSSGGSAAAVASGMVPAALGTDTGGSVRQPAAFCGVYGLKPTYGTLSRYGLVAYASSLEVAGIIADSPDRVRAVYAACSGQDPMDQTSVSPPAEPVDVRARRIGFLAGEMGLDERTDAGYLRFREAVKALGFETEDVELKTIEYVVPAYYTIATAEASANLARFNGVRYGDRPIYAENPEDLVRKSRAGGFGAEVKTRILLGTYVLRSGFQEQYYQRAQRIRTAIRNEMSDLFDRYDALVLPAFPTAAFRHGQGELDAFQQKIADRFTSLANLTALPALSVPAGVYDRLPVGIQVMGPMFSEERLLSIAEAVAERIPFQRPPDFDRSIAEMLAGEGQ
jgi:aspartyl-tRNA(Asn)/glutamyl-tRNA(Gln) amidotransferase subunit A